MNTLVNSEVAVVAIEDDPDIRQMLASAFSNTSFRLVEATNAQEGIASVAAERPGVVLLDLGLPDEKGIRVVETIRAWSRVPIIVVSGAQDEALKVAALEAGADDYLTKPFSIEELKARMRVAVRHNPVAETCEEAVFEGSGLRVDRATRAVTVDGLPVHLTPIEYKILCVLLAEAGKVVTHKKLLTSVWGPEFVDEAQYLRVYIGYLRRKLETNPDAPKVLLTEPRIGYRLSI